MKLINVKGRIWIDVECGIHKRLKHNIDRNILEGPRDRVYVVIWNRVLNRVWERIQDMT